MKRLLAATRSATLPASVIVTVVALGTTACDDRTSPAKSAPAPTGDAGTAPLAVAPGAGGTGVATVAFSYEIDGMHCEGCVAAIEDKVGKVPGVTRCAVDLATNRAEVEGAGLSDDGAIRAAIERLGYKIRGPKAPSESPAKSSGA